MRVGAGKSSEEGRDAVRKRLLGVAAAAKGECQLTRSGGSIAQKIADVS